MKHFIKNLILGAFAMIATSAYAAPAATSTETSVKAILAGGCFWCLQHDLKNLAGVSKVTSGYAGGSRANPTYKNYHDTDAANPTPHIEVVEVTYNPAKIAYPKLLEAFLQNIDPTDNEGQFCDRGMAYRPAIFVSTEAEKTAAKQALAEAGKKLNQQLKIDVLPTPTFWAAEDYHQNYAEKNPARYNYYRWQCGRDAKVKEVWGK